jgi:hypothetical protein
LSELRRLAAVLVAPETSPGTAFRAVEELYGFLCGVSGFDPESPEARLDLQLPQGRAIGPAWAAHTMHDFLRTRKFLRGILAATRSVRQSFPADRLHLVYAGPGPFATLLLPLLPLLDDDNVEVTFVEVSPGSVRTLETLIRALDLGRFVRGIVQADATVCRLDRPAHLAVLEMMQGSLRYEPQVAATLNLASQILPGGRLVPERIAVQAGLLHGARNQQRMVLLEGISGEVYRLLGPVFELTKDRVFPAPLAGPPPSFPEVDIALSGLHEPGMDRLALFTEIRVFEEEVLTYWESALTVPEVLLRLQEQRLVGFRYRIGEQPGFEWRVKE